jgi:hypothetical protein
MSNVGVEQTAVTLSYRNVSHRYRDSTKTKEEKKIHFTAGSESPELQFLRSLKRDHFSRHASRMCTNYLLEKPLDVDQQLFSYYHKVKDSVYVASNYLGRCQ